MVLLRCYGGECHDVYVTCLAQLSVQLLKHVVNYPVVAVYKHQVFSSCMFYGVVARAGPRAAFRQRYHLDTGIFPSPILANVQGGVGRLLHDAHNVEITERLAPY